MAEEEVSFYLKNNEDYEKFLKKYKDYESYSRLDDNLILSLIESGIFLFRTDLILKNSFEVTNNLFKQISKSNLVRKIRKLVIDSIAIDDKAFVYLAKTRLMRLEEFYLSRCHNVENKGICVYLNSVAAKHLRKISFIELEIENSTLVTLLNNHEKMRNLNFLEIRFCKNIGDDGLKNLFNKNFKNLKTVMLDGIKYTNVFLQSISTHSDLLSLESLTLIKNKKATHEGFKTLFSSSYLKNLNFLHLENLQGCNDDVIKILNKSKPKLKKLILKTNPNLFDEDIIELSKNGFFTTIEHLEISDCSEVNNETFNELFERGQSNSLKSVSTSHLYFPNNEAFEKLFSYKKNSLETIQIEGCTDFSDISSNKGFLSTWKLENLKILKIEVCPLIGNTFFQNLKHVSLPNLEELIITENPILNDIGITYLSKCKKIKNLKRLYIENCKSVNNRAFEELVKSSLVSNLEILSVKNCEELNDELAQNFEKSNLKLLKKFYLQGTSITSDGVDMIIYSPLMKSIQVLGLTNAVFAFPAFYLSENCGELVKIEGSFDGVSKDDIINLFKSPFLNPDFDFSDIVTYIPMDEDIINSLSKSQFQTKVLYIPLNDIHAITVNSLIHFISSETLHPFFDIDSLIKECKALINDELLIAMSKNKLCVNNLFHIDLAGTKGITENAIISLLTSIHLCPAFKINEFLLEMRAKLQKKPDKLIECLSRCTFTPFAKKLDFTEYWITNEHLKTLLINPNPFKMLKQLIINETQITREALNLLLNWEHITKLVYLGLSDHKKIEIDAWEEFFGKIVEMDMSLKNLELEFCRVNNQCIDLLSTSKWVMNIEKLGISGCTLIDYDGLKFVTQIREKYKKLDMTDIYEDFKQFFLRMEDGSFKLSKEVQIKVDDVIDFLLNPKNLDQKQRKKRLSQIRDSIIEEVCRDQSIINLQHLDLNSAGITSKTCLYISKAKNFDNLQTISLDDTMIEDDGIEALAFSDFMKNIQLLSVRGCYYLTDLSLVHVLQCKFSRKFNIDSFVTEFSQYLDTNLLQKISDSPFIFNSKKIDISSARDFTIEDLKIILEIQKKVPRLVLSLNLSQILAANISDVSDEIIGEIANSKILSRVKTLDLTGSHCSSEGIKKLILSPYINSMFSVQPLIVSHSTLIDDHILNAISRSKFFKNLTSLDLNGCPNITNIGLQYIVRSPNKHFDIQRIIDDNSEAIDEHFISTITQQDYFETLTNLNLSKCIKIGSKELIKCINKFGEDFEIERFIDLDNIPDRKSDLITNDVIRAVCRSRPYKKKFIDNNSEEGSTRVFFDFNIRLFRKVDYGINYFIEDNTAPHKDYDDYIQHYLSFLNIFSLKTLIKLCESGIEDILDQMENISRLDFSQNNHLYNHTYKNLLVDAFDKFQNTNFMNLERKTLGSFCDKIMKLESQFGYSRNTEDEIDCLIVQLLNFTSNLEELNLSNQNVGDAFLKKFSILIDQEDKIYLPKLRVIRIRNNPRFTAIGLKYLFVSTLKRKNIDEVDVLSLEKGESGMIYFVNNGLYGLMNYYLVEFSKRYFLILKKHKFRILPFLFDFQTLKLNVYVIVLSGPFFFHFIEIMITNLSRCLPKLLPKCLCLKKSLTTFIQSCLECIRKPHGSEEEKHESQRIENKLLIRYRKIQDSLANDLPNEISSKIKEKVLFYFDEAFYTLNAILSGNKNLINRKSLEDGRSLGDNYHKIVPTDILLEDDNTEYEKLNSPLILSKFSFILSNLKWIFLFNLIIFWGIVFGFSIWVRNQYGICNLSTIDQVLIQVPFFIYTGFAFLLEFILMYEVSRIINNHQIITWKSFGTLFLLINSQLSKYDMFTDVNFVLQNYWCQNNWIFIVSFIIMSITTIFNIFHLRQFIVKMIFDKDSKFHSTKYINTYSKFCFLQEMHGIGKILDKFSTSSAEKFNGWLIPSYLENVYIPLIIISTFERLILEDLPQLAVQLIALFSSGNDIRNFSTLTAFLSTIVNLILTLHTVWNVKPSYFSRDMFKIYFDVVNKQHKKDIGHDDYLSETESDDFSSSWRDTTDLKISDTDILHSNIDETIIFNKRQSNAISQNETLIVQRDHLDPEKPSIRSSKNYFSSIQNSGLLYTWGDSTGSLGYRVPSTVQSTNKPRLVEGLPNNIMKASLGFYHSLAITGVSLEKDDGKLFTFGSGKYGALGHNDGEQNHPEPKEVEFFSRNGLKVVDVSCGDASSIALTCSKF